MAFRPQWYDQQPTRRFGGPGGLASWSGMRLILTVTFAMFVLQLIAAQLGGGASVGGLDPLGGLLALRAYFLDAQGQTHFNLLFPVQLVSYAFVHELSLGHVGFNMLYLWFFGREIEAHLGKSGFLRLYLTGAVVGGLAQWVLYLTEGQAGSVVGASGAVYAVMVLYALKFPRNTILIFPFFIPIPVIFLMAFKVAGDLMGALSGAPNTAFLAHLGGAAVGLLWHRRGDVVVKTQDKLRRHRAAKVDEAESDDRREMDRILRKIQANGLASLTGAEREFLDRRSKELRQRRD